MDINEMIIRMVEKRLLRTKKPCNLYKIKKNAARAALQMAMDVGDQHRTYCAKYVVVYIKSIDRYVAAIGVQDALNRPGAVGGYVGTSADRGFLTF